MPEEEYIVSPETDRQYRLIKMYVDVHAYLRDYYSRLAIVCELILLVFSVVACAFTFAGDEFCISLGWDPVWFKYGLGALSIFGFTGSLILLLLNPRGHANNHKEAVRKWVNLLASFRKSTKSEKLWQQSTVEILHKEYYQTADDTVSIPSTKFVKLKSRYLIKVQLSKLKSEFPGCPRLLLWIVVRAKDTLHFLKGPRKLGEGNE